MAAVVRKLRPTPPKEPVVRFDGLPGEYAQFHFGECEVELLSSGRQRVQFFCGRLKYSRFMHVVRVEDQKAEMPNGFNPTCSSSTRSATSTTRTAPPTSSLASLTTATSTENP